MDDKVTFLILRTKSRIALQKKMLAVCEKNGDEVGKRRCEKAIAKYDRELRRLENK